MVNGGGPIGLKQGGQDDADQKRGGQKAGS